MLTLQVRLRQSVPLDLFRFRAAPGARLSHLAYEVDGFFSAQC